MADFRTNETNITTRLGTGTIGIAGFTYNDAAYNVFSAPISNSQAIHMPARLVLQSVEWIFVTRSVPPNHIMARVELIR